MKHFAILLLCLSGCVTAKVGADLAQTAFEPYSVEVAGPRASANSKFIAIDRGGAGSIVVRGPKVFGGPIEELKRWRFEASSDRRAYAIQFQADRAKPVVLVPATWEQARASMPHLPE
jgi:hypothetical protein